MFRDTKLSRPLAPSAAPLTTVSALKLHLACRAKHKCDIKNPAFIAGRYALKHTANIKYCMSHCDPFRTAAPSKGADYIKIVWFTRDCSPKRANPGLRNHAISLEHNAIYLLVSILYCQHIYIYIYIYILQSHLTEEAFLSRKKNSHLGHGSIHEQRLSQKRCFVSNT